MKHVKETQSRSQDKFNPDDSIVCDNHLENSIKEWSTLTFPCSAEARFPLNALPWTFSLHLDDLGFLKNALKLKNKIRAFILKSLFMGLSLGMVYSLFGITDSFATGNSCSWDLPALTSDSILEAARAGESSDVFLKRMIQEGFGNFEPEPLLIEDLAVIPGKPFLIEPNKVFRITGQTGTYFYKKVSCKEALPYAQLKQTAWTRPECILERLQKDPEFLDRNFTELDIPHFPEVLIFKQRNLCRLLMKQSVGDPVLNAIHAENVGRSLALLHSLGLSHGDLHGNNIFRDALSGRISLIDLDTLRPFHPSQYGYLFENNELAGPFLDVTLLSGIETTLKEIVSFFILSSHDSLGLENLLANPSAEVNQKLQHFKESLRNIRIFFRNYESGLPRAYRDKFRSDFLENNIRQRYLKGIEKIERLLPGKEYLAQSCLEDLWEFAHGHF